MSREINNFFHIVRHGLIKIWIKTNKQKAIKNELEKIEDQLKWLEKKVQDERS